MATSGEITQLLVATREGSSDALDRLMSVIYDELRSMAHKQLNRRRPSQTLNTTALVHEAYLKLVPRSAAGFEDRNHFLAVAAVCMRHILVNYARDATAKKRGGDYGRIDLDPAELSVDARALEILDLDEALTALAELDERLARLVELRFFGGLTVNETASVLELSERTVKRDWRKARAYLYRSLSEQDAE